MLEEVAATASSCHTFLLCGATHPAFSDVFLILPDYLNRLVGLGANPLRIIDLTIDTVVKFLESGAEDAWEQVQCVDSRAVASGGLRNLGELVKVQRTSR